MNHNNLKQYITKTCCLRVCYKNTHSKKNTNQPSKVAMVAISLLLVDSTLSVTTASKTLMYISCIEGSCSR